MKLEEFNKIVNSVSEEQKEIFNKAKELFNSKEYDLKKYIEIGAHSKSWYSSKGMLEKFTIQSKNIEDMYIDDLIEYLKEFKDEFTNLCEIGKELESESDAGDCYMIFIGYQYHYYSVSEEMLLSEIGRLTREKIKDVLKPESVEDSVIPDCKIVQLFRDGSIDWETLQKITYKNCDL